MRARTQRPFDARRTAAAALRECDRPRLSPYSSPLGASRPEAAPARPSERAGRLPPSPARPSRAPLRAPLREPLPSPTKLGIENALGRLALQRPVWSFSHTPRLRRGRRPIEPGPSQPPWRLNTAPKTPGGPGGEIAAPWSRSAADRGLQADKCWFAFPEGCESPKRHVPQRRAMRRHIGTMSQGAPPPDAACPLQDLAPHSSWTRAQGLAW